ncbi:hypothetical protein GCM10010964_10640 [Caldovatus sediminis]|uniref:TRAP C4-dicarboxylate transport system permease DctM subunit domain-containing protein n=1 Tax=Caldovatus sediminis TaxID=2041189 RepID=A0A8J2Z8V3_9PROT|nr:phytanoyl-CoA dioxygenase family protein [Caldovatus sediminis]GGG24452.1 hypothetical protein GCM10010964_10640 [Caldovatus sediminis]
MTANYILLSVLVASALTELGAGVMAARLLIIRHTQTSNLTPPVCTLAFAAAAVARSAPWQTGLFAFRIGLFLYLIPIVFVTGDLLNLDEPAKLAWSTFTTGMSAIAFAGTVVGYILGPLRPLARVLLGVATVALYDTGTNTDWIGLALMALVLARQFAANRRAAPATGHAGCGTVERRKTSMRTSPPKRLTPAQAAAYDRDGFVPALDAFSPAEADALRARLDAFEATLPEGGPTAADRRKLHVRLPWMRDLVEDRRILDAVEDLVGPDILVFNSTFFIKEPGTPAVTAWHQDATFFGLEPRHHVTAWLAFSDASVESGCMQFVRGSRRWGQLPHAARAAPGSINHGSQTIAVPFDPGDAPLAPLRRGQFSLHHTLVVHQSGPNRGGDRRIGLEISCIPAAVRHHGTLRMGATLVAGEDRHGHFAPEPDPRRLTPEQAGRAHRDAYARYREGYAEQMAWHARDFPRPAA